MSVLVCALCGLYGGAAVEGLEAMARIRRRQKWPYKRSYVGPWLVSIVIRLAVSAGLAAAIGSAGAMSALSAVAVGAAAPVLIEKIASHAQAVITVDDADDDSPGVSDHAG